MNRTVAALVFGGMLTWASVDPADAGDEPPVVTPPILSGPVVEPPARTVVPDAAPIPERGPILVLPGMNTPRRGTRVPRNVATTTPVNRPMVTLSAPTSEDAPLPGTSDAAAPAPYQGPRAGFGPLQTTPARDPNFSEKTPTPVLNSAPIDREHDEEDSTRGSTTTRKPVAERKPDAPRRPSGLFSRMFPPAVTTRNRSDRNDPVTVEPRTDPAADASVKRRIERVIRDKLGDRLRTYDVRVVGKEVIIRAKAARFWQKRAVRNELDGLPGFNNYKVSVEMID